VTSSRRSSAATAAGCRISSAATSTRASGCFAREQRELRDRFKNVVGIDPLETVSNVAQKNYQRWKAVQEEVFSRLPGPWGKSEKE